MWEDGFCDFSACASGTGNESTRAASSSFLATRQLRPNVDDEPEAMNPELFFKMSHEVYNYGEGYVRVFAISPFHRLQTLRTLFRNLSSNNPLPCRLMGKVAVDNSHKWVYKEPLENEISFLSPWHASLDPVSSSLSPSSSLLHCTRSSIFSIATDLKFSSCCFFVSAASTNMGSAIQVRNSDHRSGGSARGRPPARFHKTGMSSHLISPPSAPLSFV